MTIYVTASPDAVSLSKVDRLVLDVVIPVYNEEADLAPAVRRLDAYLRRTFPYTFEITIADNASTDATPAIAADLAETMPRVRVVSLPEKGRGRALRAAWTGSEADVLAYMDVDLSTDLAALLPLVAPLISGHSDLAIGTRLSRGARVVRGRKREVISRCYNLILRGTLHAHFSDAQCGFKAIRRDVAEKLLPEVVDGGWFFDTELLVLAQRNGLRTHEVPVDWVDDPDSRVDIVSTAIADLKGVWRLGLRSQLVRFLVIGVGSTLAYLALYALLRISMTAQTANLIALLVTAVANTAVNRRLTFGVRGSDAVVRHHLQGLLIFAVGLALTSSALAILHVLAPAAPTSVELTVLILANLTATVVRFVALRLWVFPKKGERR
jgi:glycosyltransferase involved in cell wall biosynthesis